MHMIGFSWFVYYYMHAQLFVCLFISFLFFSCLLILACMPIDWLTDLFAYLFI